MTLGLIALAVFAAFFYYALIRAPRLQRPWSVVVAVGLSVVLALAFAWFLISRVAGNIDAWRPFTALAASLLPFFLYLGIGTVALGLVNLGWSAGQMLNRQPHLPPRELARTKRLRFVRLATIGVVIAALGVTGYGYNRAHHPTITQTGVTSAELPAQFDGFRIALLTDIHVGPGLGRDFVQGVVDQINAAQPDLIVIAGDLADGTPAQLGDDMLPLTELKATFGVLVTTGNHEFYSGAQAWIDWLDDHGLPVLDNSGVVLSRGGASIDILGINDRTGRRPHQPDLQTAVDRLHATFGVPVDGAGRFRILVAHEPVQVYGEDHLASRLGVDLQLSGHTHGGQLWPVHYLVTLQQPVLDGTHVLDGITVVTSRGAGAWGPPVRIGAPPEIPIVTLHRAA